MVRLPPRTELGSNHHFVDPGHELLDVGVDAGQVLPAAADAPGDEADERLAPLERHG